MSSGLASDEVAEDYKNSLEDLTTNDRFQISNLTVIAKENTEHAMAISRVLENHIRTTPPTQKLPALYVVDSIVKNVGSPYTLFLGRNMYQTFMNAYTLVDSQTRRKLDEMLKTWKEPVPGSLDTRPVFPPEITRGIESALIKARTAALQQQQSRPQPDIRGRNQVSTPPRWTNSPTMVQNRQQIPGHFQQQNGQAPGGYQAWQDNSNPTRFTPTPQRQDVVDLAALNRDIEGLITSARGDFANNPLDPSIQQRLKALLDLQGILQRQELTQEQLKLVRDQVSALGPKQPPVLPTPPIVPSAVPVPTVSSTPSISTPPTQPIAPPLQQLLNPGTLAELIKATTARQTPPPQVPSVVPQVPMVGGTPQPAGTTPTPENPLIAALKARGLLSGGSAAPVAPAATPAPGLSSAFPLIVPGQVRFTPPVQMPQPMAAPAEGPMDVQMNTMSIKIPRNGLIAALYETKPNRCGTCGRRFPATDEGKEKKARHLDWHFKTNQRMADAAKRAQNRSWYVDERDWIKSREVGDDVVHPENETAGDNAVGPDGSSAKKGPPKQWIHAPNDATLRNTPCPICQEKFESTWSEDVQDWIWQDAVKVGSRVYHASCYAEVTKGGPAPPARGNTPLGRTGTPDSVLGKRKAEGTDSPGHNARIKTEPV